MSDSFPMSSTRRLMNRHNFRSVVVHEQGATMRATLADMMKPGARRDLEKTPAARTICSRRNTKENATMHTNHRFDKRHAGRVARCSLFFLFAWLGCAAAATAHVEMEEDYAVSLMSDHFRVPLVLSGSDPNRQGLVRIINRSNVDGEVAIYGVDDTGARFGPVALSLAALSAVHVNSSDLTWGNPAKGVFGALGTGIGDWHLELDTHLDIAALAYSLTADGYVSRLDAGVTFGDDDTCTIDYFNPASVASHASSLRLTNLGDRASQVVIAGFDDRGQASSTGSVQLTLSAGQSRNISARDLESGTGGLLGRLGIGNGTWRLALSANQPLQVMNLLHGPVGILSVPANCDYFDGALGGDGGYASYPPVDAFGPGVPDIPDGSGGSGDYGEPAYDIEWITDPYELVSASIEGDTLLATVSYGGGCRDHVFELQFADVFIMTDPLRLTATLLHESNDDPCEAWLTEHLEFDLTPVKDAYGDTEDGATVVIQLVLADGSQRDLEYTF